MPELKSRKCKPCSKGDQPLQGPMLRELARQIDAEWRIIDEHHLLREYDFSNFKQALAFVNQVAAVAEEEGHHPTVTFTWGWARIELYTHKVDGLSENDFILASKIDAL